MADEQTKTIVYGILSFLQEEFNNPNTSADSKESLEVSLQCLETAFGVTLQDVRYKPAKSLRELVSQGIQPATAAAAPAAAAQQQQQQAAPGFVPPGMRGDQPVVDLGPNYDTPPEASEANKEKAEDFKNLGNDAMKNMSFSEALAHYTKAVDLDGRNSVYFCNRAAAYIKLEQYDLALRDCQIAIRLQPNYARAYGRMGVTYSNQNKHIEAITCFQKAVSLEPGNESYINNLRYSQSILAQEMAAGAQGAGGGAPNIQNFFNNPTLINMASQMLQDPSMQQMMQNVMAGFQQGAADPANPMENLLQMGQAIANQIRTANPQLAEQLGVSSPDQAGGDPPANGGNPNNGGNNL